MTEFAHEQGWSLEEGRIYFPLPEDDGKGGSGAGGMKTGRGAGDEEKEIISSVVGYARELESIV